MSKRTPPDEVREALRQIRIDTGISFEELSARSKEFTGVHVSTEAIRKWAMHGRWGDWLLTEEKEEARRSVADELDEIRQIVFEAIRAHAKDGLILQKFTDDTEKQQVHELIKAHFPHLVVNDFNPTGVDHQLVNAYMNLLSKSGTKIESRTSGKTARQQILEMVAEHGAKS